MSTKPNEHGADEEPALEVTSNGACSSDSPAQACPEESALESTPVTVNGAETVVAAERVTVDAGLASELFLRLIPRDFARAQLILSQGGENGVEHLIVAVKTSPSAVFNVGVRLGATVDCALADAETIARAIDDAYLQATRAASSASPATLEAPDIEIDAAKARVEDLVREADKDLLKTQGKNPVIKLVDALLFEAVGRNASDVHFQPNDEGLIVRYRVDGALVTVREIPQSLSPAVLGRVKVMGRMDVAEHRVPQDGRASVLIGPRVIDLRIGTFPTSYGERAVLRLLDSSRRVSGLDELGMPASVREPFLKAASRDNGLVLVTGPTGSGKTTTLYSTLSRIASSDVNVITIEDPIEYDLARARAGLYVSQSQVNLKKGVTFANGLRHLVRQDPDVILVGEIRDTETAKVAVQSSLTGHLVFTTLHTNDAPSAITRLFDLGVEPYLVSASLIAVLAQRLVRVLHRECEGRGCGDCLAGFKGRVGVYEFMAIDENGRRLIARNAELSDLRKYAASVGMRSLREEGERLIAEGLTTRTEVERVIQGGQ